MRGATTIQETRDVVILFASAFDAWVKTGSDGKRSLMEWIGFSALLPQLAAALKNSGHIIDELRDLDESEMDDLIRAVAPMLNEQVNPSFHRKINKLLVFLHAGVDLEAEWRGVAPPKAQVVP